MNKKNNSNKKDNGRSEASNTAGADANEDDAVRKLAEMEKDKRIARLEDENNELKNKISEKEKSFKELQRMKNALAEEKKELAEKKSALEERVKHLEKTIVDRDQSIKDLLVERDSLRKEVQTVAADYEKIQKDMDKLQTYKSEVETLRQEMANLGDELEKYKAPVDDIDISGTPSAIFRIDIYKRQGEYNGRIIHTLTKDKKAFRDIDGNLLKTFIKAHLPGIEDQNGASKDVQADEKQELNGLAVDFSINKSDIAANKPFTVHLTVNKGSLADDLKKLNCVVELFARSLTSGKTIMLINRQVPPTAQQVLHLDLKANPLSLGMYRFEGAVFFQSKEGKPTKYMAMSKSELFAIE